MGTASAIGTAASIIAFGTGLLLGINIEAAWPVNWALGVTFGIFLSFSVSLAAEFIDHRKRYSMNTVGTHVIHEYDGATVEDCFSCSGADADGYRVEWAKDDVLFGLVRERHGGGVNYYCSACHEDPIEAGLRAGNEREFREQYEGEDHYMAVLADLRDEFLEQEHDRDFWEWVGMLLAVAEENDKTDPREYADHSMGWLDRHTEDDDDEAEVLTDEQMAKIAEQSAEASGELDGLPDEHY